MLNFIKEKINDMLQKKIANKRYESIQLQFKAAKSSALIEKLKNGTISESEKAELVQMLY